MPKLSVYLSSRIRQHTLEKNKAIGELFERDGDIKIFLPHTISPSEHHEKIHEDVYRKCVDEINNAEILLLLAEDWMVKGSVDVVLITNNELYKTASKDVMLRNKKLLMVEYQKLPEVFRSLARGGSNGSK